jgi:hypothetical protein
MNLRYAREKALATFGVIGLATSLVGSIEPFIRLTGWLLSLIDLWRSANHWLWNTLLSLVNLSIPAYLSPALTSIFFVFFLGITSSSLWRKLRGWILARPQRMGPGMIEYESVAKSGNAIMLYLFIMATLIVMFVGHAAKFRGLELGPISMLGLGIAFFITANLTVLIANTMELMRRLTVTWILFGVVIAANLVWNFKGEILGIVGT